MTEATGMESKTIHRLLEYTPMDGYKRNEENPLEGDALIVDECSMIDILLFYNLMKAIPSNMRLILVGDIDQLPIVGTGNVLRDIIDLMKIRNNYDKNVFNGDIGYITAVDTNERTLTVSFDNRLVEYDVTELDEMTLADAITIHKSQVEIR